MRFGRDGVRGRLGDRAGVIAASREWSSSDVGGVEQDRAEWEEEEEEEEEEEALSSEGCRGVSVGMNMDVGGEERGV
jgi:hypothetical protein